MSFKYIIIPGIQQLTAAFIDHWYYVLLYWLTVCVCVCVCARVYAHVLLCVKCVGVTANIMKNVVQNYIFVFHYKY